jgi:hypothetical protein
MCIAGAVVASFTAFIWVVAYRAAQSQPGAGHFMVPLRGGALIFFVCSVAVAVGSGVSLARAR